MTDARLAVEAPHGFRVVGRLGSGQTSTVYLAEHVRLGRVALKLPRADLARHPLLLRMFESEVVITLKLDHPRVVRGLQGNPTGSGAFLALEVCPGGTLDQMLLERGRLPVATAVRLVEDVTEGLLYTHAQKVLHRDVKPANVFLTDEGRAKLGDFGTGTFMAEDGADRVGTAFYMAPEIFEGGSSSVRSDVYALGILAYEVLSGERPFVGETYEQLMHAHLGGLVKDLTAVRDEIPPALAAVVRMAMARLPARRYRDVGEFLDAWRDATPEHRVTTPQAGRPPSSAVGRASRNKTTQTMVDDRSRVTRSTVGGSSESAGRSSWWKRLLGSRDDSGA